MRAWDFFFNLSTRGRMIAGAVLVGPIVVWILMMARHKAHFEDGMKAKMLEHCEVESAQCQAWLDANHEACFDAYYRSSGRTQTTTVDQWGYNFCVEHGPEAAREKRREEFKRRTRLQ